MRVEDISIDLLLPYSLNAKQHPESQIEGIAESIKRFGFVQPVVVDKNNEIIIGHGRVQAAQKAGLEKVPTVCLENLNEQEVKALRLIDNRIAETGWDVDLLNLDLDEIDYDFENFNISFDDILVEKSGHDFVGYTDEDDVPEIDEDKDPVCKLGDIWQLGEHRLMCGDSTDKEQVEKLMDGQKAEIGFTSPPYNVGKTTRGNLYKNDNDQKSDYVKFLNDFTNIALNVTKFLFVNIQALHNNWKDVFLWQHNWIDNLKDVLIWNKTQCPPNIQKGSFNTKFEFLFSLTNEKIKGRNFPCEWQGKYPNVIETESNSNNDFSNEHKAGFPVSFPVWLIEKMDFAKNVYEPFCGTGTTIIACEKTNRKCYGMELDPHYCDVIIKRWQDFTGKEAKLVKN